MENNNPDFIFQEARMLPIIMMLDCSGSMDGEKINALNIAIKDFIISLQKNETRKVVYGTAIYTFSGNGVQNILPLKNVKDFDVHKDLQTMTADGQTPMGEALQTVKQFINEEEAFKRCYRPIIMVVSDGAPNDSWEKPLDEFVNEGRTSRCERYAVSIGADRGTEQYDVLLKFTGDPEKIYDADQVVKISRFFKTISKSIVKANQNGNINKIEKPNFDEEETSSSKADADYRANLKAVYEKEDFDDDDDDFYHV